MSVFTRSISIVLTNITVTHFLPDVFNSLWVGTYKCLKSGGVIRDWLVP